MIRRRARALSGAGQWLFGRLTVGILTCAVSFQLPVRGCWRSALGLFGVGCLAVGRFRGAWDREVGGAAGRAACSRIRLGDRCWVVRYSAVASVSGLRRDG